MHESLEQSPSCMCDKCNQLVVPKTILVMYGKISTTTGKVSVTVTDTWLKFFLSTEKSIKDFFKTEKATFYKHVASAKLLGSSN